MSAVDKIIQKIKIEKYKNLYTTYSSEICRILKDKQLLHEK